MLIFVKCSMIIIYQKFLVKLVDHADPIILNLLVRTCIIYRTPVHHVHASIRRCIDDTTRQSPFGSQRTILVVSCFAE
jgi:hypothetical protein